jgi:hypothetical protein
MYLAAILPAAIIVAMALLLGFNCLSPNRPNNSLFLPRFTA